MVFWLLIRGKLYESVKMRKSVMNFKNEVNIYIKSKFL